MVCPFLIINISASYIQNFKPLSKFFGSIAKTLMNLVFNSIRSLYDEPSLLRGKIILTSELLVMRSLTIGKLSRQLPINLHHGHFYQVRCRALDCRVDCLSLRLFPGVGVGPDDGLEVAFPSQHGLNIALLPTRVNGGPQVSPHC